MRGTISVFGVVQGCCNHWDCPRCGQKVASAHYGRIVEGARHIAASGLRLYFVTLTCRGKECTPEEAWEHYLDWTSRFLDAAARKSDRDGGHWCYAQVTELQRRGLPHSHLLTTFSPHDLVPGEVSKWKRDAQGVLRETKKPCLRSTWIADECARAGLGDQYDVSVVRSVEAASRYVAKYMFKRAQFSAHYPPRWKRVRYSQSWPKLPDRETDAFVLLSHEDWMRLADKASVVYAAHGDAFDEAHWRLRDFVGVKEMK